MFFEGRTLVKDLRIYVITLFANFALSFVGFFGVIVISALSFRDSFQLWSTPATTDPTPLFVLLFFGLVAGILINVLCFRYCKTHKVGGAGTYVINICVAIVGIALPFIMWQSIT